MNVIEKLVDGARHRVGQVLGRAVSVEADFLSIRAAAILGGIGRDVVALHYPSRHPDHGGAGRHVLHHYGVGADANVYAVNDEETTADLSGRMNLDAGLPARHG